MSVKSAPVVETTAEADKLDSLLSGSGGAFTATLEGSDAASVAFATDYEVCGIKLRSLCLSDLLLLLRMDNLLVAGKTQGANPADTLASILQVLFLGSSLTSRSALALWGEEGLEGFGAAAENYAAGLPMHDAVELFAGVVEYISDSSKTRVSAKAPEVSGNHRSTTKIEGND